MHVGSAIADTNGITWAESKTDTGLPPVLKYSVVVVSWGFHAQIVRQSEALRVLGNQRFKVSLLPSVDNCAFGPHDDPLCHRQVAAMKQLALNQRYPAHLYLQDGEVLESSGPSFSTAEATFSRVGTDSNIGNISQTLFTSGDDADSGTTKFSYFVSTKVSDRSRDMICRTKSPFLGVHMSFDSRTGIIPRAGFQNRTPRPPLKSYNRPNYLHLAGQIPSTRLAERRRSKRKPHLPAICEVRAHQGFHTTTHWWWKVQNRWSRGMGW